MPTCAACSTPYEGSVYRTTLCEGCGKELKTCLNCRHFDVTAPNQCREPVSDPVAEKDRANFCDWFRPAADAGKRVAGQDRSPDARKDFDNLFGDG